MKLLDYARLAGTSLIAAPVRSCLTMIGIIIGVAAMTSMAAIGSGARSKVTDQIRSFGANVIIINASNAKHARPDSAPRRPLSVDDAVAIGELPAVSVAAPSVAGQARLISNGPNWGTTVNGTTLDHFAIRQWHLASGRFFNGDEEKSGAQAVVLGSLVAQKLFDDEDPIGRVVRIVNAPLKVVGVLSEKGAAAGSNQDDVAFVPLSTAKNRLIGGAGGDRNTVDYILASAVSAEAIGEATKEIEDLMQQRRHIARDDDKDFTVSTAASIVAAQEASTRTVSALLAAVAGVSLIVGGIGIMNIMLVSVTERTREIGIRMAIGARRRRILAQFLFESVTLSLLGGLAGVLLGAAVAVGAREIYEVPARIPAWAVVVSLATASGAGLLFGMYPAARASKLDPVEAMRTE
jgi:putative ABC transport system permease protein